jgi:hypothetical protein
MNNLFFTKRNIMNLQKFALGSVAGGIIKFFLGFLFIGVLLKNFLAENGGPVTNPDTMVWWALVLGNLFSGVLLVYFFMKANISTAKGGAGTGFIVGLLVGLGNFLVTYAITQAPGLVAVAAHTVVSSVNFTIAGAVVGWILGYGKKTS